MQSYQAEICIVGAGPGGMVCSLFLSQYKIPHVLVDKSTFPRDKVCGEAFDGRVIRILNELSPDYLQELYERELVNKTWDCSFSFDSTLLPMRYSKDKLPKLMAQRKVFDHFLFEKVQASPYVTTLTGQAIQEIKHSNFGVQIKGRKLTIEAKLGIIANGAQSSLSGLKKKNKEDYLVCARRYYRNVSIKPSQEFEVHYLKSPLKGCLLICPSAKGVCNIEVATDRQSYQKFGVHLNDLIETCIDRIDGLRERFVKAEALDQTKGNFMPIYAKVEACADDHLMMVGANAFSVHPITGMGVGNAMTMGMLAAQQAKRCVEQQDFSKNMTAQYEQQVKKRLAPVVRLGNVVNFIHRNIHTLKPIVTLFIGNRLVQSLLVRSDLMEQLNKPKFYWNLLLGKRKIRKHSQK